MKATLEFSLPEESQEFKDYQDGVKLKYFMHQWLQAAKWKVENPETTAFDLLEDLKDGISCENINIFE